MYNWVSSFNTQYGLTTSSLYTQLEIGCDILWYVYTWIITLEMNMLCHFKQLLTHRVHSASHFLLHMNTTKTCHDLPPYAPLCSVYYVWTMLYIVTYSLIKLDVHMYISISSLQICMVWLGLLLGIGHDALCLYNNAVDEYYVLSLEAIILINQRSIMCFITWGFPWRMNRITFSTLIQVGCRVSVIHSVSEWVCKGCVIQMHSFFK